MAITGISAISGEQIIAAGAISAREAASATFTISGNSLQGLYDTVSNNSGTWTGGQASLPITALSGDYSANYDVSQVVIDYQENQGEPTHYRTTVGAEGLNLYNSTDEDQTNATVDINPEYIEFKTTDDQHASIDPYTVLNWNSTYNTVYDNSASWTGGGGSTYTGDAQGALDEVYSNSANWNSTYTTVSSNSGAWGGSALPISAGPGIKLEMVNNTLVASNDETLLWSGASNLSANPTFNLNEPATAFSFIEFQFVPFNDNMRSTICQKFVQSNKEYDVNGIGFYGVSGLRFEKARLKYSDAQGTAVNTTDSIEWTIDKNSYTWTTCKACMYKIVGINRIAGV